MNVKVKLQKARSWLILDHPFFGCLIMKLKLEKSEMFPTAATDGKKLFYNPVYIESLSLRQTIGLLAHEIMHPALGHTWRQDSRENKRWNVACDYTINRNLIEAGFTLPDKALDDPIYRGMSAEEIYNLLPEDNKDQGQGQDGQGEQGEQGPQGQQGQGQPGQDPGMCGAVIPGDKEKSQEQKARWKASVSQAAQVARGTLPGGIEHQIKDALNPELPWATILRDFVEKTARNDYSWSKPNPRYSRSRIILPSLISEELPELVIAIDTSCSITDKQLAHFETEASAILGTYNTKIRVLWCDTEVAKEEEYASQNLPLKLKHEGGGGTKFEPVFDWVEKFGYTPAALIYFTDMDGSFPDEAPTYPVLWVSTNRRDKTAPFGEVVRFRHES